MLKPLLDRILLQKIEEEKVTQSGLIISDKDKEKPNTAKVVAVGPGKTDDAGKLIPMNVSVGDVVIYKQYTGTEVTEKQQKYVIVEMKDVLAIVEEDN